MKHLKIAIASGKGGTGKTFVSTNLFYTLFRKGIKTTLTDCDAEEPNAMLFFDVPKEEEFDVNQKVPVINEDLCTFCGRCHDYCNYNAIIILPPSRVIKVIEDLCHDCGACLYACKDNAITEKEVVLGQISKFSLSEYASMVEACTRVGVYSPVSVIKEAINTSGNESFVIMDAPPGTSCPFIQTVNKASFVVLVTEPTPFGLSDLKQSVDTLKTMSKCFGVIINRAGLGDDEVYSYLSEENIPLLMEIPFDRQIASCYSKGELIVKQDAEWENRFYFLYQKILDCYGNCSSKR